MELILQKGSKRFLSPAQGFNEIARELGRFWDGEVRVVAGVLKAHLKDVAMILRARHSSKWPSGGGQTLSMRSGRGMTSILRSVDVKGTTWETLSGSIGGNRYLAIHETGGTIVAKKQFLTIPLPAALTSRGEEIRPAPQWEDTFVGRSQAGNLLIFQRRGAGIVPLYVLKSSVYIPARLGMRSTIEKRMPYFAAKVADAVARDFVTQLGG